MNNTDVTTKTYLDLLRTYLGIQKRPSALLALLVIISITLQLINPQVVRYFLDTAESGSGLNKLLGAAGIFIAIALVRQGIDIAATYVGEQVAWTATNALRADLAAHCLGLDMAFHKVHKPGELIERVDGDVNQMANFFSQLVVRLTSNVLLVLGVLVLLWLVDWRIGLATTAVALLGAYLMNAMRQQTIPRWGKLRQVEAELFGNIEEWLSGTEVIRTNRAEPTIMNQLYAQLRQRWLRMSDAMRMNAFLNQVPTTIFTLAYIAAFVLGDTLFRNSTITIGTLYLVFYYIDVLRQPLWDMKDQIEDLQRASASVRRVAALFLETPTISDGPGVAFAPGALAVAFDDVSFHFADEPETAVLDHVTFALQPGRVLGLLGRTGSGKTTLTKLLFRFYDVTDGAVRIGGHDVRQAQQDALRQRIGMVTQEVELFNASVRENLTLFDPSIADGRIIDTLHTLGLSDWLAALPDGLDTHLSGSGNLSAGEAQLLAFARVFLADPGLVVLDEASSRLDPVTEQLIEQAIDKLLANRTAIIVAHRLATVQRADEILILENGRVVEHGRRQDLIANPDSRFAALLHTGLEVTEEFLPVISDK